MRTTSPATRAFNSDWAFDIRFLDSLDSAYWHILYSIFIYDIILMKFTIFIFTIIIIIILAFTFIEPFTNPPIGPTLQNNSWSITDKNTTYYPSAAPQPMPDVSSIGAGPCLVDNHFSYTLGNDNKCAPTSSSGGSSSTTGSSGGGSSNGGGSSTPGGSSNRGGSSTTGGSGGGDCIRTDLPPTVFKTHKSGANHNFWCRFAKHNPFTGFKSLFSCSDTDTNNNASASAKCSPWYYNGFYKWGNSKTTTNTECMPWDADFVSGCLPNTFKSRITGDCPPGYGIGLCEKK